MRAKFLFIAKIGRTKIFRNPKTQLSFRRGDILLQDKKWDNIYRAINVKGKRKERAWVAEPYEMIQDNSVIPLNIKALWVVIYTKLGQPHYSWYARFFKNVRGY